MITEKQTLEKIELLKNELFFYEQRLKEFIEFKSGDMARVIDASYSCNILGERGKDWNGCFHNKIVEVITTGYFPSYNDNKKNDTMIRYNGELYFIQKRFLEKVI